MADPVVHLTAGVPDSGTGNITTLGQTLLDGAQLTQGAMADAAASTDTATASQVALFKRLLQRVTTLIAGGVVTQATGSNLHVVVDSGAVTATVSGTATVSQGTGTNLHTVVDSGAVTANAGTNLNTSTLALESGGNLAAAAASLASIVGNTTPVGVLNGASRYNTIAASQTAQVLTGGSGGATGDHLAGILVIPATTSPGVVTVLDNATSIPLFVGGSSSVSNLVPFFIPIGALSVSGAWKITTGSNVSCFAVGKFT